MSNVISELNNEKYLPEWVSLKLVENLTIVALVLLGVILLLILRFVSKLLLKLSFLTIVFALALGVWSERSELSGCISTCSCEIFGQNIQIPLGKNPFCDES